MAETKGKKKAVVTEKEGARIASFIPYEMKRGEEYMSERMLEHFRQILLAKKAEIMDEVDATIEMLRGDETRLPDPNDQASREEERRLELRTRDREGKLLRKVEEVLDRLENNDYGYCANCGVEIGVRRLEARPTATLCIDCKTLEEIKEKHQG